MCVKSSLSFSLCSCGVFQQQQNRNLLITKFYNRMTVHCNRFLVNKTNRCTEFQFYWYYDSTCFGQPFCPSSGVLSRTSALVHFMKLWWPFATRSRMELREFQSRCTAKNSWWWAQRLPETCGVVIPIKLEFSASVGFIYNEFANNKYYSSNRIVSAARQAQMHEKYCMLRVQK
jgi:hypothetical protein